MKDTGSSRRTFIAGAGAAATAGASADWAFSARSMPERDSETSRRRAAFGSAEDSQASVRSRVSSET
ncbi:hypothetical protein, partial [Streptomyces sp. NPDC058613]|uniref:hypothetical protein n=1 Tax=Streptomyces sp. NPDC058613 TaxID=3346556 RepID=UPI003656A443